MKLKLLKTLLHERTTKLLLTIALIFAGQILFAQDREISGTVIDNESGEGLPGVTVVVKGNESIGTITGLNGEFTLNIPSGVSTIIFSSIGYETFESEIGNRSIIDVNLKPGVEELSEIVVTALGVKRQEKSLGYAVQKIDAKNLEQVQDPNLVNNLRGKVAGVNITQGPTGVGSTSKVVIRGETSLTNNNPLFVVDGVPVTNYSVISSSGNELSSSGIQEADYGNSAGEINPYDIESISVLKGASASALYGSRANNGVIMITTKSGNKKEGIGVELNVSNTFESLLTLPEYQNTYGQGVNGEFEFGDGLGGGLGTNDDEDQSWGPAFNGQLIPQFDGPSTAPDGTQVLGGDVIPRAGASITPTEWRARPDNVRDFFDLGRTTITNVALSASNESGDFRASFTNLNNEGIVPGTDLNRNSIALKTRYNFSDNVKLQATANYIKSTSDHRPANGYGSENHMYVFTWYGRQVDTKVLKDNLWQHGLEDIQQFNYNYAWHDNPYINSFVNTNALDKDRFYGNLTGNIDFTDDFSLMIRHGIDFADEFRPQQRAFSTQRFPNGGYMETKVSFLERNSDFLFRYDKDINEFGFSLSWGASQMDRQTNISRALARNLAVPGFYSLNNASGGVESDVAREHKRVNSTYGLAQLRLRNTIFLDITGRNDWSSTLPENNNSYFYPSVSLSAVLSDMFTMPAAFSFVKVRANWASVGNDTEPYRNTNTLSVGTVYGTDPSITSNSSLANPNLKPERSNSWEVGADFRLFEGKVNVDLAYYNILTKDQIIERPVSTASGANVQNVNALEVQTNGFEAMISVTPVDNAVVRWTTYANFNSNESKFQNVGDEEVVYGFSRVYGNESRTVWLIAKEGGRVGDMFGTGFVQADGQDLYQVVQVDGSRNVVEPVKDPNLRLLGNNLPDFTLGWGNNFQFGKVSFSFLFDGKFGGEMISRTQAIASTSGNLITTDYRPEEGITPAGVVNIGSEGSPNYQMMDANYYMNPVRYYKAYYDRDNEANHMFDATFVKLREVNIGYDLPIQNLFNGAIKYARLSFVGRNLLLFTEDQLRTIDPNTGNYDRVTHFDPEVMAIQGNSFVSGVEDMTYPSTRSYGFSLNVKF